MSERLTILYIGGYGRSGSTLLERILGQVPGFFSAGELRHIWERSFKEDQLCGCGETFRSCEFWSTVREQAFGSQNGLDLDRVLALKQSVDRLRYIPRHALATRSGRYGSEMAPRIREYSAILERLYRGIQSVSGARVIVDSSKDPSYAFLLNALAFTDLRVMHLVRDSRAVAYSWSRRRVRPEIQGGQAFMPQFSPIKSSVEWNLYNYFFDALSKIGACSRLLRYEDFVRDPAPRLPKTLDGLGLGGGQGLPFTGGRKVELGVNHTVSGNPMRFQTGTIEISPDVEWRDKMTDADRRLVTALTSHLIWRYGYLGEGGR